MRKYFDNKGLSAENIDISNWPLVLTTDWDSAAIETFNNRVLAMKLFIGSDIPLKEITQRTGIHKNDIYRFAERCLKFDSNGEIYGFRALIPYVQTDKYRRKSQNKHDDSNFSGSFTLLLEQYPILKDFLIGEYFEDNSKKISAREKKINYKNIHRKFINECRKCGIKPDEYPFNTTSLAIKSVKRFLQNTSNQYYKELAKNNGGQASMLLSNTDNSINSNTSITRPLERVEFDGHRIDAIFTIEYTTPNGEKIKMELNRIWILTLVDVATRSVIGYHLCLRREYNSDDVKKCFQSAIVPWKQKTLTIPGLQYSKEAGFPSSKFPEAEYAIWDEICYDNAKAHLSHEVKNILHKYIGCSVNMGPVAVPVRRPIIERFFKTLEQNSFHRLPSTTGSNPLDPKRKDAEKNALKFSISYELIEELCDVIIANYNSTPHESNMGFSPLEIFSSRLEQGYTLNQLSENQRNNINLFPIVITRYVKGNINEGRRPYIYFKGTRYSSPELSNDFSMINEKVTVLINTEDLRTVEIFRKDGTRYGSLIAAGQWGLTPHTLKFKDAINKFRRERYFSYTEYDDPIDKFQEFLETQAINNKALRGLLADLQSYKKKYHVDTINAEIHKKKKNIELSHLQVQNLVIEEKKHMIKSNENIEMNTFNAHELIIQQKLHEKQSPIKPLVDDNNAQISTNLIEATNQEEQSLDLESNINDLEATYHEKMIKDGQNSRTKKRRSINL